MNVKSGLTRSTAKIKPRTGVCATYNTSKKAGYHTTAVVSLFSQLGCLFKPRREWNEEACQQTRLNLLRWLQNQT